MSEIPCDANSTASMLALAFVRLRARLREESSTRTLEFSISQLSILQRLHVGGPATAASLALAEHVSQQAVAQSLAALKSEGLVEAHPDPADGRKVLISLTHAGHSLRKSVMSARDTWLAKAIGSALNAADVATLNSAIEIIERLTNADC